MEHSSSSTNAFLGDRVMSAENKPKRRGKNQLSRRDFLRLGVGSAAAVAASAASPVFSAPMLRQGTGDPAVVRFWSWYTDQEDQFPKVVADFEALNPNIKVETNPKIATGMYTTKFGIAEQELDRFFSFIKIVDPYSRVKRMKI